MKTISKMGRPPSAALLQALYYVKIGGSVNSSAIKAGISPSRVFTSLSKQKRFVLTSDRATAALKFYEEKTALKKGN